MSDRDELAHLIHRAEHGPHGCPYGPNDDQKAAADAILKRGYRKATVTPEQIETAAGAIRDAYYEDCGIPPGCEFPTEPAEWLGEAKASARAFGLVPEDGEQ